MRGAEKSVVYAFATAPSMERYFYHQHKGKLVLAQASQRVNWAHALLLIMELTNSRACSGSQPQWWWADFGSKCPGSMCQRPPSRGLCASGKSCHSAWCARIWQSAQPRAFRTTTCAP